MIHRIPIFVLLFLSLASPARAMLVGDTIFLSHRFPNSSNLIEGSFVPVVAGEGDLTSFGNFYSANPEDSAVFFNFFQDFTVDNDPFNGHVAGFIDSPLSGVQVDSNINGWDDSRLGFNQDSFELNWAGLSVNRQSYLVAYLQFQSPDQKPPVTPEPMTLLTFSAGLLGAYFSRKRIPRN